MSKGTKTHHDMCGACTNVSLEHTPEGFPQPGEIAEKILSKNPDWSKLHNMIAVAISRRDRLWSERIGNKEVQNMEKVVLFDMDGTITPPRKKITREMTRKLADLSKIAHIGIVTGSGYDYLVQQCQDMWYEIGSVPSSSITLLPCNGTQVYKPDATGRFTASHKVDMRQELGDEVLNTVMTCLTHIQFLHTFSKPPHSLTGHFISYRDSMINWCPVGRNANNEQREEFIKFDTETGARLMAKDMIQKYLALYGIENVVLALGGSTSIDIFPEGWDKTYALQHFQGKDCWFVGDSCGVNGNDRTIYEALKQKDQAFITSGPEETLEIIDKIAESIKEKIA